MDLCNSRNKLFEDKNIKPSDYPYNAKSEEIEEKSESEYESESESEFEKKYSRKNKNEKTRKI